MAQLFQHDGELGVPLPAEISTRYHLAEGGEVEVIPTDEGILLKPVGVAPWFSLAWEEALEFVIQEYRPALEMVTHSLAEDQEAESSAE
jgi:hypothetical protein